MADKIKNQIEITNRKASYEYFLVSELEAGIQLHGTEVKSIRLGNANLTDAYCYFKGMELFVRNLYIGEYKDGTYNNHDTRRERKLLLRKGELKKLHRRVTEKGMSIVPIKLFINDRGFAKLIVALSKGKKSYDKRESIKKKDNQREMDRLRNTKY